MLRASDSRIIILPGDLFFTRSTTFLGRAIRVFQRSRGESKSVVNHVGVMLGTVSYRPADLFETLSVEALSRVRLGRFWRFYSADSAEVAIYRDETLTRDERQRIAQVSASYAGRRYGYLKLGLHLFDWGASRVVGRDVYLARRLAKMDRYPICSYLGSKGYSAVGRHFGVTPSAAQPDDMWDYVIAHPRINDKGKWRCVLSLRR
jgi:hypothetical protein